MMLAPPLLCECVDHARSGTRRRASVPGSQDGAQQRHVPCAPSQTSVEVPVEHVSAAVDTLRRWPPPLARAASPASTAAPTPTAVGVPRSTCRWMCCDGWRSRPSGVSVANVSPRRRRQALHGLRPSRGDGLRPPITGQRGLAPPTPTRSGWRAQISLTDSVRRVLGVPWGDWDGRHWEASHPILMGAPTRRSRPPRRCDAGVHRRVDATKATLPDRCAGLQALLCDSLRSGLSASATLWRTGAIASTHRRTAQCLLASSQRSPAATCAGAAGCRLSCARFGSVFAARTGPSRKCAYGNLEEKIRLLVTSPAASASSAT